MVCRYVSSAVVGVRFQPETSACGPLGLGVSFVEYENAADAGAACVNVDATALADELELTVEGVEIVEDELPFFAVRSLRLECAFWHAACASGLSSSGHNLFVWPVRPQFEHRTFFQRSKSSALDLPWICVRICCFLSLVKSSG